MTSFYEYPTFVQPPDRRLSVTSSASDSNNIQHSQDKDLNHPDKHSDHRSTPCGANFSLMDSLKEKENSEKLVRKAETGKIVEIRSLASAPSRDEVLKSCGDFGIPSCRHQGVFCSRKEDVPEKGKNIVLRGLALLIVCLTS